jgi:prevent-host-death family protein
MKAEQQTYTVKEFSVNPSRVIHRALQGVEVTISLRGVPAVRLVPVQDGSDQVLLKLGAIPGFQVAQTSPKLARPTLRLSGTGPTAAEMILEDRR